MNRIRGMSLMYPKLNQARALNLIDVIDVINSIVYSHHVGSAIVSDHENTVKNFGLAPPLLGRGHAILEPSGPVWVCA